MWIFRLGLSLPKPIQGIAIPQGSQDSAGEGRTRRQDADFEPGGRGLGLRVGWL